MPDGLVSIEKTEIWTINFTRTRVCIITACALHCRNLTKTTCTFNLQAKPPTETRLQTILRWFLMLLPHVPPPITPNHQQPIRQIMQRRAQRVKNMSTKGATRLQVFSDARKSDPGKLLASCTCTPVKITLLVVTLKSHDKEGARSESNKQTEISAQRMHSFYTIHMGCGYLPGGCEQYSIVRGSHDPRCK